MRRFLARIRNLLRGEAAEREAAREITAHLGLLQEEFERRGLAPADAGLAARRAYGGVERAKELHREERSFPWVEHRLRDLRHGIRSLRKAPAFTTVAVVTLALGIGANAAIFSVVNAVLLQPLPYREPDRLVTLLHQGNGPVSVANYIDWRDQSRSFETLAAAEYWSPNLTGTDSPEHVWGLQVTQNLLPMLGVNPLLGRLFRPGEDQPGSEHEVILSHRLWQRRFNSDRNILGRPITLNGESYTIVGVMPPEFQFAPFWATRAELWAPDAFGNRIHNRGGNSLRVFARLKAGTTLLQARAETAAVTQRLERQYPGTNRGVRVTPLKENVVGNIETPLLVLLGAVGFVLLIACANVAHMILARTTDRSREIAVRSALGGSRRRLVAQFLTENLMLAAFGALAGLAMAMAATKALVAMAPAYLPRVQTVAIDSRVLLFLGALTVMTTLIFGFPPAAHAAAGDLIGILKEGGRGSSEGKRRGRLRNFLVASEFALAFILMIGAGLMVRSFAALRSIDPGFDPHHVLSMVISVAGSREAEAGRRVVFYRQLIQQLGSTPGIESAGAINHLPLAGDNWGWSFIVEGRPKPQPGEAPMAVYRIAMPGYFETMRIPVRRGRAISWADDGQAPGVAVINERAASQYWPGEDPLGKRISFGSAPDGKPVWLTIVGIVKNARQDNWAAEPGTEVYLAALQHRDLLENPAPHWSYLTLVVRASGDPAGWVTPVKQIVWSFDPNLPISEVFTMNRVVADATAQPRFEMLLLGIFAVVALLMAAVGIYGVMSYSVSKRTHEIGIRMSLGAGRAEVLGLLMKQGLMQALAGSAAGLLGALLLARLMARILYAVKPTDPLTFGGAVLVLVLAALAAVLVPASKAIRVDPVTALRHD